MPSNADISTITLNNYLDLIAITIQYYDYLITVSQEISRIWTAPRAKATLWFVLNRYIPPIGHATFLIFVLGDITLSEKSCRAYTLFHQVLFVFNQTVVGVLMMLRTCALFGNSRRVLAVLGLLAITALALAFWSALTSQSVIISGELVRGCHSTLLSEGAVHIAIPWETQVGFDLAIFILTIVRSYKCRNYSLRRFRTTKTERVSALGLADLIARDGAIYCRVMVLANIANILTFYIASVH